MESTGCIVCGDPIKAKYLCAKHHQRYIRSGSVYLKKEEVDHSVVKILNPSEQKSKDKMNLSRFI